MKKKLLIGLSVLLVLAFAVPAFAGITGFTDAQKKDLNGLQKQMIELRKQMVDKYVDAGQMTKEQGQQIKDNLDKAETYREQKGIVPGANGGFGGGCGLGRGANGGCGGGGCGFGAGAGAGASNTSVTVPTTSL